MTTPTFDRVIDSQDDVDDGLAHLRTKGMRRMAWLRLPERPDKGAHMFVGSVADILNEPDFGDAMDRGIEDIMLAYPDHAGERLQIESRREAFRARGYLLQDMPLPEITP